MPPRLGIILALLLAGCTVRPQIHAPPITFDLHTTDAPRETVVLLLSAELSGRVGYWTLWATANRPGGVLVLVTGKGDGDDDWLTPDMGDIRTRDLREGLARLYPGRHVVLVTVVSDAPEPKFDPTYKRPC